VKYDRSRKFDEGGRGVFLFKWKHFTYLYPSLLLIVSSPTKSIVNAVRLLKNSPITFDLQNGEQKVLPGCHALPDRSSHFLNIVSIEEIKGAIPHF